MRSGGWEGRSAGPGCTGASMFGTPGSAGLPCWCLKSVFFRLPGSPAQTDPQLLLCRFEKR